MLLVYKVVILCEFVQCDSYKNVIFLEIGKHEGPPLNKIGQIHKYALN